MSVLTQKTIKQMQIDKNMAKDAQKSMKMQNDLQNVANQQEK